jgi:hypothetical protein
MLCLVLLLASAHNRLRVVYGREPTRVGISVSEFVYCITFRPQ